MPLIYFLSLALAGIFVSAIGAWFSVSGLASLFSGAALAVMLMAGGLEFSKFVVAAFLHRTWYQTNFFMRMYMSIAVITLSIITSMGIFGFLTNAYQRSTQDMRSFQIQLASLEDQLHRADEEQKRGQQLIDEIPANRITKKINTQKEWAPRFQELRDEQVRLADEIRDLNLRSLETNTKVGPILFVAKEFDVPIESVVKYLTLIFVFVFDPLAICLIIATSMAYTMREDEKKKIAWEALHPEAKTQLVTELSPGEPFIGQAYSGPTPVPNPVGEEEFATLEYGTDIPEKKTS